MFATESFVLGVPGEYGRFPLLRRDGSRLTPSNTPDIGFRFGPVSNPRRVMAGRRYTVIIADRSSGVVRRVTISLRPFILAVVSVLGLPILIGLGAKWSGRAEMEGVRSVNSILLEENSSYREATGALTAQIQSLEGVIDDLGVRAKVAPELAEAMQKLPAAVKARAAGGTATSNAAVATVLPTALTSPEDTFGVLRDVLGGLENRLRSVRSLVERREQLAAATPSLWPTRGGLSGFFGDRADPFTGEAGFHQGIDISTDKGQPVYATADGTVQSAAYTGDYGNLVVVQHRFGLATRYGHLSRYGVHVGDTVKRGQILGYVGSTGRSTGAHLHYEILVNGKLLNPLQLLTRPPVR
jgi:murein DD-endopeptidase MepM/ murein hydrolase activator NlpD